tara:strand:+ start:203 stop:316 length:114 start_codon:yes stop_codon:yes gene_type:complete
MEQELEQVQEQELEQVQEQEQVLLALLLEQQLLQVVL